MDRINKFLEKRPVKHRKVLRYNDKSYEITKEDLKAVRAYRSQRCLDSTFTLSRPPDLRYSSTPMDALPARKSVDNGEMYVEKARRYYERHPVREKTRADKNAVVDVWENDTVDTLRSYRQEWVYSIKEAYNTPVEDCVFTREHLHEELRRVYLHQFRPREIKSRSIDDLLPKLPDSKDLRPFPEAVGREWKIEGKKHISGGFAYSVRDNRLEITDLGYGKTLGVVEVPESINHVRANDGRGVVLVTDRRIYTVDGGTGPVLVHESGPLIKDAFVSGDSLAVLTTKTINLYSLESHRMLKTFVARYENPHRVKIFDGTVYVSTANGLLIESPEHGNIKTLNYVIDFTVKNSRVLAINNLNRLIVIGSDFGIKKNIVQPEMGREIKAHRTLNLFAILFANEIGVYKQVEGEYIPVNTLEGRYRTIEWHCSLPWLYAGKASRVVLYT